MLRTLISFRSFIMGSIRREFELRYQASLMGPFSLLIQPIFSILVFAFVFTNVMKARLPGLQQEYAYSIYLCSGFIAWSLCAELIQRMSSLFLDYASVIKKISFPKFVLPFVVSFGALVNFFFILLAFFCFLIVVKGWPGAAVIFLIPILVVQCMFCIAVGLILAVLNVFFRDVGQLLPVVMQLLFWLTPIVYPIEILPDYARRIIEMNPFTVIVSAYHSIFLYNRVENGLSLSIVAAASLLLLYLARSFAGRKMAELVDEL
jgi:lipopolysaccharide transport system permease protein